MVRFSYLRSWMSVCLLLSGACGNDGSKKAAHQSGAIPQGTIVRMQVDRNGYLIGKPTMRVVKQGYSVDRSNLALAFANGMEPVAKKSAANELDRSSSTQSWHGWEWNSNNGCGAKGQPSCPPAKQQPAKQQPAKQQPAKQQPAKQQPAPAPVQEPIQEPVDQKIPEQTQQTVKLPMPEPVKDEPVQQKAPEPVVQQKIPEPVVQQKAPEPVVQQKIPEPVVQQKAPEVKAEPVPVSKGPVLPVEQKKGDQSSPFGVEDSAGGFGSDSNFTDETSTPDVDDQLPEYGDEQPSEEISDTSVGQKPVEQQKAPQPQVQNSVSQVVYQPQTCTMLFHPWYGYMPCFQSHSYWHLQYVPVFVSFGVPYSFQYQQHARKGQYVYYYYAGPQTMTK